MGRREYTPEQIISKLREAEVVISQGVGVGQASRQIGVTEQTYYRWRREYGGLHMGRPRVRQSQPEWIHASPLRSVYHGKYPTR